MQSVGWPNREGSGVGRGSCGRIRKRKKRRRRRGSGGEVLEPSTSMPGSGGTERLETPEPSESRDRRLDRVGVAADLEVGKVFPQQRCEKTDDPCCPSSAAEP